MSVRVFLIALGVLLASAGVSAAAEPIQLTWRKRENRREDILLINNVEVAFRRGLTPEDVSHRLKIRGVTDDMSQPVKVTIPASTEWWERRLPNLIGWEAHIFKALTSPEREVTYHFQGHELRRYRLTCSSKGVGESPELANYWLDGEFLGQWAQAKARLLSDKQWTRDAVVDLLFDREFILTSKAIGLFVHPELDEMFKKHRITVNEHSHMRAADDR